MCVAGGLLTLQVEDLFTQREEGVGLAFGWCACVPLDPDHHRP